VLAVLPTRGDPWASEVPHRLAGVSVLVGIQLLARLDSQGLQALKDFAYLYRLHHAVEVLILESSELAAFWASLAMRHSPTKIEWASSKMSSRSASTPYSLG
jgi:hypothetical protein